MDESRSKRRTIKYSKVIVALVIVLVAAYVVGALIVFNKVGVEPVVLTTAVFGFATSELGMISGIKKRDQATEQNTRQKEREEYD